MKKYRKFFIKDGDVISVTNRKYFASVIKHDEAFAIAVSCYCEMYRVMKKDAADGLDSCIGTISLINGLQRTLELLDSKFPSLMKDIHSTSLLVDGGRVFKS